MNLERQKRRLYAFSFLSCLRITDAVWVVLLARLVMERTPHVFLIGSGAEDFGRANGVAFEDEAYFVTPERQAALARCVALQQPAGAPVVARNKQGAGGVVRGA